jgi:hypothetical protein
MYVAETSRPTLMQLRRILNGLNAEECRMNGFYSRYFAYF